MTYNFVATVMMLSDVLPVLTCLSRALQAKTADFTLVASQLTYVQHSLQQIKEHPNDQSTFPQSMTQSQTLQLVL